MVGASYVPDTGDLVWLTFDPQAGHAKARLALACPITAQKKGYPFEVAIPAGQGIAGVVLADHIKDLDWKARKAIFESKAPAAASPKSVNA